MIYKTNKARESAQESIDGLIAKIAEAEKLNYTEATALINHLLDLRNAIEREKSK